MVYRRIPRTPALSDEENTALRNVADGKVVRSLICRRLADLGLIEKSLGIWIVTHQGQIQLMFRDAR